MSAAERTSEPPPAAGTQICGRCGATKSPEEFHIRYRETGERLTWCRVCMAECKRLWYARNRDHQKGRVRMNSRRATAENQARAWEYLGRHPCVDCGEADPVVLQFDHVGDKLREVSQMLRRGFTWSLIEAEIGKCEVRCANCHRRKTARERGYADRKRNPGIREEPALYIWAADN